MMRVLLQAGHSSQFPPYYPNGGGAPGEATWTTDLARRLAARLSTRGIAAPIVGHWFSSTTLPAPPEASARYDLALMLHYDAPTKHNGVWDASGCFADRSPDDPMSAACDRFIAIWSRVYPAATGIGLDVYRGVNNPNTDRYYAWSALNANTPAVLIEHGCGSPVPVGEYPAGGDTEILHNHIDAVADADAAAILEYLGIAQQPQEAHDVALTDAQQRILDSAAKWQIDDGGALDFLMGTRQTLAEQKDSLEQLLAAAQNERDAYMAETARLQQALAAAQAAGVDPAQVQALRDRLAQIRALSEVPA